jgi:hypothetical protein
MKNRVLIALLAAMPLELVNFFFFMPRMDPGATRPASVVANTLVFEWVTLHWPGLWLQDRFHESPMLPALAIFASGYLDTCLLILLCVLLYKAGRLLYARTTRAAAKPVES